MNLESNELVRVQSLQVFGFDVPGEFQADIVDSHRPLFVAVDPFETERLHLLWILRVSCEMKQPRALAVLQKPFAFEFSGIPRDRKMNFLPPGLGKIQLPLYIGAPDGPVAALRFAAESFRDTQDDAGDYQDKTDDSFQVHGTSLLSVFPARLTKCPRA